jgi:hypothetical protein
MIEVSADHGRADPKASPEELEAHYEELAAALDDDPFAIHAELAQSAESFPVEQRVGLIASVVYSKESAILGWLLDRNAEVREEVGALIANAARQGLVSPRSCNRMVLLRNWLAENRRDQIDAAIRACRARSTTAAAEQRPEIRKVMLSGCDGAGAQSAFVLVKLGRSYALASLLLKCGHGVKDAWVRRGIGRAEAEDMLGQIMRRLSIGALRSRRSRPASRTPSPSM